MKVRNGFVSNSSSSSFIIVGDNIPKAKELIENAKNGHDYYELDGVLYTSIISDGEDLYSSLSNISAEDVSCGHSYPYDEDYFFEFEGDRGCETVWIEKDRVLSSDKSKFYQELLALDNKDVHDIMMKYKRVWEYEIQKWLCK